MGRVSCSLALLAIATLAPRADADDSFAALVAKVDVLAKEVASLRGLRFTKPVAKEVLSPAALDERLARLAAEPTALAATASENFAYARWGLIAPDVDYAALVMDVRRDQIVGFYDPASARLSLVMRPITDAAAAELVLSHEIEHALQDQTFDLKKLDAVPDTEGDARRARRALIEGDALATMVELVLHRRGSIAPWSDPGVTAALEKSMTLPGGDALDRAPLAVRDAMLFPYQAGLAFVAELRRRQPWSAVDAAFAKPPRSTEQILHPERYLAGDEPIAVRLTPPTALATWTVAQSTVWGELGFALFLRAHGVDSAQASIAADGWGGDRVLSLSRPSDPRPERGIGIARFEWDSEPDAIEAAEAAENALDTAIPGGTIEHDHTRAIWLGIDGTVSWIERKGPAFVIVLGAPLWLAHAIDPWAISAAKRR